MIPQIVISLFCVLWYFEKPGYDNRHVKIFEEHLFLPVPSAGFPCSSTLLVLTGAAGTPHIMVLQVLVRELQLDSGDSRDNIGNGSGQGLSWREAQGTRQSGKAPEGPMVASGTDSSSVLPPASVRASCGVTPSPGACLGAGAGSWQGHGSGAAAWGAAEL